MSISSSRGRCYARGMVVQSAEPPHGAAVHAEQRFVLRNVAWDVDVALHDSLELAGSKKIIARLLEAYAEESDLDLNERGSTTFREASRSR